MQCAELSIGAYKGRYSNIFEADPAPGRCKAEPGGTPPLVAPAGTGKCKAEPRGTPPPAVTETVETKFTSSPLDEKKFLFPGNLLHVEPCAHASILPGGGNNQICTAL